MVLHTSDGCTIDNDGFTGNLKTSNCYVYAPGQDANAGCGIEATDPNSYGKGFNSIGGGIYATEITPNGISIWFFPRGSEPGDVLGDNPNPANWGTPAAKFAGGGCDWEGKFNAQRLVGSLEQFPGVGNVLMIGRSLTSPSAAIGPAMFGALVAAPAVRPTAWTSFAITRPPSPSLTGW